MIYLVLIGIIGFLIVFVYYRNNNTKLRIDRLKRYIKNGDVVLDLGCGDCCLGSELSGVNVVNIDVVNKSKCSTPVIYNGKNIPLKDKSVDVTVCAFVLHHTNNQKDLLTEMRRVTRKYILIFEDTPECTLDTLFTNIHGNSHWGKGSFKSDKEWTLTFTKLGLRIIQNDRIGRFVFPFSEKPWFYPINKRMYCLKL